MELTLKIHGCGASGGVPTIGNFWGDCDPAEPKNNRTRASIAVQSEEACLIVDTGPDFRQQLNRENIQNIDAVLYTHAHGDHVAGVDELRSLQRRFKKQIPIYSNQATMDELQQRYGYMFKDFESLYQAVMQPHIFTEESFYNRNEVAGIPFIPYKQDHYTCQSLGFRFGDISYSTDMAELDEKARDVVRGSRIWIVDGAGYYYEGSPVHASIPKIMEMNEDIGAEQVYLTHLSLLMDYQELCDKLPEGYYPCYDGLSFTTTV